MRAEIRGLSEGLIDDRIERRDASDEVTPDRARFRLLWSDQQERAGQPFNDFGRNRSKLGGQPASRATKIGACEYDARADDADADFACAGNGEHEDVVIRASDRAELVARDDCGRETGQRRRVAGKVAQQRGHESACGAPERQAYEKTGPVLRKARRQHHDCHCADQRADHAKPGLAQ